MRRAEPGRSELVPRVTPELTRTEPSRSAPGRGDGAMNGKRLLLAASWGPGDPFPAVAPAGGPPAATPKAAKDRASAGAITSRFSPAPRSFRFEVDDLRIAVF